MENKKVIKTYYMPASAKLKKLAEENAIKAKTATRKLLTTFEEFANTLYDDKDTVKYIKSAKMQIMIDSYRQSRLQKTARVIHKLDATNPYMLEKLYNYKVNSLSLLKKEFDLVKVNLKRMLRDPKRLVAKIEKTRRLKMRMHKL